MSVFWFLLICSVLVKLDLIGVGFAAFFSFLYIATTIFRLLINASELELRDYTKDEEDEDRSN